MSEPVLCGTCHQPLPVNAPLGLCPLCLLRGGVDADSLSLAHPGEAGVTALWNEELPHKSVLDALTGSIGDVPRVLLRDPGDEAQPEEPGPSPESATSETIGRYPIESRLGKGGMGEVFRGRDTDLGREIALKVLLDEHREHPELAQRFVEEAQIGGQLVHPGIVPVYEM